MADVKTLEEKVQKASEKVEKAKGTIERHEKQLAKKIEKVQKSVGIDLTGLSKKEVEFAREPHKPSSPDGSWDNYQLFYDVERKLDDIEGASKKLKEAERVLGNWQEKLSIEVNRMKFLEEKAPQVIKDFLQNWKQLAYDWHVKKYNDYQDFKERLKEKEREARITCIKENANYYEHYIGEDGELKDSYKNDNLLNVFPRKPMDDYLKERKLDYHSIQARKAQFAGGTILRMDDMYSEEERLAWLEKQLEEERKAKMLDLINRISGVVGEIADASKLAVNEKGNIDGFVYGDKGRAKVETVGAGGWNIQCFHYRTLVNKI